MSKASHFIGKNDSNKLTNQDKQKTLDLDEEIIQDTSIEKDKNENDESKKN